MGNVLGGNSAAPEGAAASGVYKVSATNELASQIGQMEIARKAKWKAMVDEQVQKIQEMERKVSALRDGVAAAEKAEGDALSEAQSSAGKAVLAWESSGLIKQPAAFACETQHNALAACLTADGDCKELMRQLKECNTQNLVSTLS